MINLSKRERTISGKIINIIYALSVILLANTAVMVFYNWLFSGAQILPPSRIEFMQACILAPVGEELVFRHFPMQVVKASGKDSLYWPVILLSSVIFGWLHGGPFNLLIQGVFGVILCILYVKNNFSVVSTMVVHALWNFLVLVNFNNL